jgi:plasmid maintenance system antidote protein VapI
MRYREMPETEKLKRQLIRYLKDTDSYINSVAKSTKILRTTLSQFIHHEKSITYEYGVRLRMFFKEYYRNKGKE